MAKTKINYTEPTVGGNELFSKELINGTALKKSESLKAFLTNRYESLYFNPLNNYQITNISLNVSSQNRQLCFMPELAEKNTEDFLKLTFTPNIKNLKFVGLYDFWNGENKTAKGLSDFPFGAVYGMDRVSLVGYNGNFDALAICGNGNSSLVNKEIGKNITNYDSYELFEAGKIDSFIVVLLGDNLRHISTLKYKKIKHKNYKVSFFFGTLYIVNYNSDELIIRQDDSQIFSTNLSSETVKLFRTYKYDLIYTAKRFILLEKLTGKVTHKKIDESFDNISFNPVLKSICIEKDDKYKVFKFFANKMSVIHDWQLLNPTIIKYAVQWVGNLEFDYMIKDTFNKAKITEYVKEVGYRGHYLTSFGEYEADYEVGLFQRQIDTGLGNRYDFHINNTDDADMGLSEYLSNRRFITQHKKIALTRVSYARMFKTTRQIVFYSADFNNNLGQLFLFKY